MDELDVALVTLGNPEKQTGGYLYHRRLRDAAPRYGAEVRFLSFPDRPFPLPVLSGRSMIARASEADVIVIDSIVAAFAGPWLKSAEQPIIAMIHQGPGGIGHGVPRTLLQTWLDRGAYSRMNALFLASESLALEMKGAHHRVRVIPPGCDVATEADPEIMDLRRGRDVALLCVGNWMPHKGIDELLDAFALLPEEAATLHLVGDQNVDPRYRAAVCEKVRGIGKRVEIHGLVPKEQVAAFYRDADVFVMPSRRETYGTVYGEAMAAGLPVVGWRAGNLPWLAEHGREGLIVEPGDIEALAQALLSLSRDKALRESMGRAASVRAAALPTWEQTADRFFGELRKIL
jgi:glycosyltransferase involved in cell wall biosynthesis